MSDAVSIGGSAFVEVVRLRNGRRQHREEPP
jgi:hypothetical protein